MSEKILGWIEDLGDSLVIKAMEKTLMQNKSSWSYAEGILKRWAEQGIDTLEKVEAEEVEFQNQSQARQNSKGQRSTEVVPDWMNQQESSSSKPPSLDDDARTLDLGLRLGRSFQEITDGPLERYDLSERDLEVIKQGEQTSLEVLQSKSKLRVVGN